LESLLTGTGRDLDLITFKLVDQLSGRLVGLRADITPQVARIDAHLLNRKGIARLCYVGNVLHARPSRLGHTREPLQIGAEVYGHVGIESDIEIQRLIVEALHLTGIKDIYVDLGHVGIFRALVSHGEVSTELESELFKALQTKDGAAVRELAASLKPKIRDAFLLLPDLYGGGEVLDTARAKLPKLSELDQALNQLQSLSSELNKFVEIQFDLAELRGYHYHSGVVFAAYAKDITDAIALGGRYDEVGKAFGKARPATGFSMDLRELSRIAQVDPAPKGILAPYNRDSNLQREIAELRKRGEVVIDDLPGHADARSELECDRELVLQAGKWQVVPIKN
jgi:ATP phosphoribosyltransferase regulatory subunit